MGALDVVYAVVIEAHRKAIEATEEPDPVTQDMLIEQAALLEQFHWFVRAHLESPNGSLATAGAQTERGAASRART
jgi:starvation-inducible DNA-binding protein